MPAARDETPIEGEILGPADFHEAAEAVLWICVECECCVLGDRVVVTEQGLVCANCEEFNELSG